MTETSPADVRVAGLFSYPVKSCRGVAHAEVELATTGLLNDRLWMIVDARSTPYRFVTQRECPTLATISVSVFPEGAVELAANGYGAYRASVDLSGNALCRVKVWGSELVALDAGDEAANWLSTVTGLNKNQARLVRFHPNSHRACNPYYAKDSGAHTHFADGYPVLVTNQASLDDLNRRIDAFGVGAELPMSRFRPNIVLSGLAPWDEDFVDTVEIGDAVLQLVKPCVRCEITTTDQLTGSRFSDEPLNTLGRFRTNPDLGGVTFGWNAIVLKPGQITNGASVSANYRF